jgi:hypothetical protein
VTLEEIARRLEMQPWYVTGGEAAIHEWIDPHSTTANRPIPHSRLRIYLLTGDRPLRIAAKVLRADPFDYDLVSRGDVVSIQAYEHGIEFYSEPHADEATAYLAAAEAMPTPEGP